MESMESVLTIGAALIMTLVLFRWLGLRRQTMEAISRSLGALAPAAHDRMITAYVERQDLERRLADIPLHTKGVRVTFDELPEPGTIDEFQGEALVILRVEVDIVPGKPGRALLVVKPIVQEDEADQGTTAAADGQRSE